LPALQRDLVWDTDQIERLFDSLMQDYPIGSFLFWHVEKKRSKDFQFYDFIRNYHALNNKHIKKMDISGDDDITAILDGQQRLTALYIGLKGTYAYKLPRKQIKNPLAYPERKLYINLLSKSNKMDVKYDFRFLTEEKASKNDENYHWFRVGEILNFEEYEVNNYLLEEGLFNKDPEKAKFANKTLFHLHKIIHTNPIINYYLEESDKLDKVLNIFIRINSGGTPLSYSDLLLSIASTEWKEKDARDVITNLVDEINNIGNGFNFNSDFVLKSCLVLSDFKNIAFKVDNFKRKNMLEIEKNWDQIADVIRSSVELVSSFGYNGKLLVANNALIPIAYYLLKIENPNNFFVLKKYQSDRKKILKWLDICLLKRIFGFHSDNVLKAMREVIEENNSLFPLEEMVDKLKGTNKSLIFDDDEIENLFYNSYGGVYTFSALSILYPSLDFNNEFHVDHIHPKSFFNRRNLEEQGIENIDFYLNYYNDIENLQLLEGPVNEEKSNKDFEEWLNEHFNEEEKRDFMNKHYIPDVLDFKDFEDFITQRRELMREKFESVLFLK